MPRMKQREAEDFIKTFEKVIHDTAEESFFRYNANPIRCGLVLYKMIDDLENQFELKSYTSDKMKQKLYQDIIKIIDIYSNP